MIGVRMTWPMFQRRECEVFGRVIALSPNESTILSTLLMRSGSPVATLDLISELWPLPDDEPDNAKKSVWRYIEMLRKVLGRGVILTVNRGMGSGSGYMIARP
jgi:DNA-binding winged helix-turn-helix (wHTH) protein